MNNEKLTIYNVQLTINKAQWKIRLFPFTVFIPSFSPAIT